jgi:hypothetical protein
LKFSIQPKDLAQGVDGALISGGPVTDIGERDSPLVLCSLRHDHDGILFYPDNSIHNVLVWSNKTVNPTEPIGDFLISHMWRAPRLGWLGSLFGTIVDATQSARSRPEPRKHIEWAAASGEAAHLPLRICDPARMNNPAKRLTNLLGFGAALAEAEHRA